MAVALVLLVVPRPVAVPGAVEVAAVAAGSGAVAGPPPLLAAAAADADAWVGVVPVAGV
ncbi:hypothetical protein [Actinomycetospora sp. NBRC 106378]|uniref:hypothetical protein n=1 Tax=Actinomycetospora sp. NBRC 106378 TaxID=3032208 RepID=UPI0024A4780C|nr:hypothetical protein [Actinomycetospora sp. NBRC 106378]GLZ51382.1 hypothetical protein Acsp07_09990 [Actinomycetospora sp. NBRC 106378]